MAAWARAATSVLHVLQHHKRYLLVRPRTNAGATRYLAQAILYTAREKALSTRPHAICAEDPQVRLFALTMAAQGANPVNSTAPVPASPPSCSALSSLCFCPASVGSSSLAIALASFARGASRILEQRISLVLAFSILVSWFVGSWRGATCHMSSSAPGARGLAYELSEAR